MKSQTGGLKKIKTDQRERCEEDEEEERRKAKQAADGRGSKKWRRRVRPGVTMADSKLHLKAWANSNSQSVSTQV